jgi:hypothetical protein
MGLIQKAVRVLREEGTVALSRKGSGYLRSRLRDGRHGFERLSYDLRHPQKHVFDDDWDTLIVLDACRYDIWKEVVDEHSFLDSAEHRCVHSPASSSKEWMQANFADCYADAMRETAYVTANPFTQDHANEADFALLDEVWKYGWDDDLGVVPPDTVTDRAIDVARSEDAERTLVHYMQPHFPSLRQPELGSKIDPENNSWISSIWDKLKDGEIDHETVWGAYRDNLHDVLESVETLLRNHDASKVIITADHGNGFGEDGIYGHPGDRAHRVLREVPYCVTEATDEGEYTPELSRRDAEGDDAGVEERLAALGYIDES